MPKRGSSATGAQVRSVKKRTGDTSVKKSAVSLASVATTTAAARAASAAHNWKKRPARRSGRARDAVPVPSNAGARGPPGDAAAACGDFN